MRRVRPEVVVCPDPTAAWCEPGEEIAQETRRAQVVGLDLETKILKTEDADLKPYLDYSRLLDISNPTGVGAKPVSVIPSGPQTCSRR